MCLRFFFLAVAVLATASHSQAQVYADPSMEALAAAVRQEDHGAAMAAVEGEGATQLCFAAMLRDQRLRSVYLPPAQQYDLERRLWASGMETLERELPFLIESYERCVEQSVAHSPEQALAKERLEELQATRVRMSDDDTSTLEHILRSRVDVSWSALRSLVRAHATERPAWRTFGMAASITNLAGGVLPLAMTIGPQGFGGSTLRLASLGVLVGSVGGLIVQGLWWNPHSQSATPRLVAGALWTVGSLVGGAALLARAGPQRFRAMGIGLLVGGAVDAIIWSGALALARTRGRPQLSVRRGGGSVGWSQQF